MYRAFNGDNFLGPHSGPPSHTYEASNGLTMYYFALACDNEKVIIFGFYLVLKTNSLLREPPKNEHRLYTSLGDFIPIQYVTILSHHEPY